MDLALDPALTFPVETSWTRALRTIPTPASDASAALLQANALREQCCANGHFDDVCGERPPRDKMPVSTLTQESVTPEQPESMRATLPESVRFQVSLKPSFYHLLPTNPDRDKQLKMCEASLPDRSPRRDSGGASRPFCRVSIQS